MCGVEEGGIGIHSLHDVFAAFSIKLWWNFWCKKTLWFDSLQNKYCKGRNPCIVTDSLGCSLTWKRMLHAQDVVEDHMAWQLRDGSTDFWYNNWLLTGPLYKQVEVVGVHKVCDFVAQGF